MKLNFLKAILLCLIGQACSVGDLKYNVSDFVLYECTNFNEGEIVDTLTQWPKPFIYDSSLYIGISPRFDWTKGSSAFGSTARPGFNGTRDSVMSVNFNLINDSIKLSINYITRFFPSHKIVIINNENEIIYKTSPFDEDFFILFDSLYYSNNAPCVHNYINYLNSVNQKMFWGPVEMENLIIFSIQLKELGSLIKSKGYRIEVEMNFKSGKKNVRTTPEFVLKRNG